MLLRVDTHLKSGIFRFFKLHQKAFQISPTIAWRVSSVPAHMCANKGIRHLKISSHVMEKLGSNVAAKEHFEESHLSSSYETAMEALSSLITRQKRGQKSSVGGKYGKLDRMLMYLEILDLEDHLSSLKIIHVAGTKGKGSTCIFSEAILRECGLKTGLFTSPHLIDVRERFRINGLDISEDKFLLYFWDCWHQLQEKVTADLPMPPLFQFLSILAFKMFVCEKVDVAIIEVGLGGRMDSTNVIKEPVVCGIASLGMDHIETLGDTLGKIASHKAGIFKEKVPAFTVPQLPEAMDALRERAHELMVPLETAKPLYPTTLKGIKLSLSGDHQLYNAGLAVSLCKSWLHSTGNWEKLSIINQDNWEADLPDPFLIGLSTAHLAGRAQILQDTPKKAYGLPEVNKNSSGDLIFYLDGAHSPESMDACAKWFSNTVQENKSLPSCSASYDVHEFLGHGHVRQGQRSTTGSNKLSKQILLFNCMEVRDPQILLPHLVSTCASSGTHFSKAIFVPSMSQYNKVTSSSSAIPLDVPYKDLTWQFNLQRIWERLTHGKEVSLENYEMLPPREFLSEECFHYSPADKYYASSAVIPSLPLTIKWLRESVKNNPSLRLQVLVTGSLHLVGDVLKLIKRIQKLHHHGQEDDSFHLTYYRLAMLIRFSHIPSFLV